RSWNLTPGSHPFGASGRNISTRSSGTWTGWRRQRSWKEREGESDEGPGALRAARRIRRGGSEGRREVDARSRERTASLAGESLDGADGSRTAPRVGAVRCRRQPRYGRPDGDAHDCRRADADGVGNDSETGGRPDAARVQLGWPGHPLATGTPGRRRHPAHALAQHQPQFHFDGRGGLAHLLRCDGSSPRRRSHWTTRRRRCVDVRRLATVERGVRGTVRKGREVKVNSWIRQTHRWVSMIFTLTVIANFVVIGLGKQIAWVTYSPLLPLALLLFSGLYLFALPYASRLRSRRAS